MDLATARPISFVSLAPEEVERTASIDPTVRSDLIPAEAYRGQAAPVATLSTPNVLVVRADMSEELAYRLIQALLEAQEELEGVHPVARQISPEYTLDASPIPLHPGAVRYLNEIGHDVPERLIPGP